VLVAVATAVALLVAVGDAVPVTVAVAVRNGRRTIVAVADGVRVTVASSVGVAIGKGVCVGTKGVNKVIATTCGEKRPTMASTRSGGEPSALLGKKVTQSSARKS
jgi:hypothetical protein